MGTIGAVTDLVKHKRDEWLARVTRDELEDGDVDLANLVEISCEINSLAGMFTTLVDRDGALTEAGIG
jgi:hypothetical protein